ncbi:putative ferric reductase [Trypanosoma vivax]|uniref:Putative ferric reductase n=1 Tax=Trypanosoma vivax (strain Y486) TaxID=1055687 RepID=G0UAY4_TRYVY|nr:putative ferric reductase [Trypanosoma vivax]CCC52971.1 putative ferric reductase [Trypanosoma vivax Y486]
MRKILGCPLLLPAAACGYPFPVLIALLMHLLYFCCRVSKYGICSAFLKTLRFKSNTHTRLGSAAYSFKFKQIMSSATLILQQHAKSPLKLAGVVAISGLVGVGVSLSGLLCWSKVGMFVNVQPHQKGCVGYDLPAFTGLLLFTALSLPSISLLYLGVSSLLCLQASLFIFIVSTALGLAFVLTGVSALLLWNEMSWCSDVFVAGILDTKEQCLSEVGKGLHNTIAITAFFVLVPVGIVLLFQVFLRALGTNRWHLLRKWQWVFLFPTSTLFSVIFATLLLTFFGVLSLILPNSWAAFSSSGILDNARKLVTRNYTRCRVERSSYTCPEVPWSWFQTRNWAWSDALVLKSYPSNVIFYLYAFILLITTATVRLSHRGRTSLRRRCRMIPNFTYGEICFILLTVSMLSLFFFYWMHDHNYKCRYTDVSKETVPVEKWARSLGQLATAFLSLCIASATRHSVLHSILGTSWDSSIWVHKLLGYGTLFATAAHAGVWYVRYYQVEAFPRGVFSVPAVYPPVFEDDFTVPLVTLASFFAFVSIGVFALPPIRRKCYEVFYYAHIVAFYTLVPAVLWHAAAAWEYLLPGLTVWLVDWLLRMHRRGLAVEIVYATTSGSTVSLCFRRTAVNVVCGQYFFVNVPELSLFQWHPFSLSSEDGQNCTMHIKSMGDGTWTDRLLHLVEKRGGSFSLFIEGPYGQSHHFTDYKRVVLVAGGIGVTPCASIFNNLHQRLLEGKVGPTITLLWTLRDARIIPMLSYVWDNGRLHERAVFSGADASACASVELFLTDDCFSSDNLGDVSVSHGRVDLRSKLPELLAGEHARDVLVFSCGPRGLVQAARNVAISLGANFHEENFLM